MKKNLVIAGLVVLCLYTFFVQPSAPPKRPLRDAIAKAIKWLPFVLPFVLDEPQHVMELSPDTEYGSVPSPTTHAPDGFAVIDHGENW